MHCAKISRADQKMTPPPWVLDYDTLELSKQVDQLIIGEKLGEPGVAMRRKPGGVRTLAVNCDIDPADP